MTGSRRRVALVLGSSTGGIGQHVRSLAAGAVARGWQVTVACPAATAALFGFAATGASVVPVEIPASPRPADAAAVWRLRSLLHGVDVTHAHGLRAGLLAGLARPRRQPPLVVTWHNAVLGARARRTAYGALERVVARRADVTLAASADLLGRARALGARDARLGPVAAPEGRSPGRPAEQVRADVGAAGRPLVLAVGRLHRQKRHDVLVRAAAQLSGRRPAPLVAVAGEGPERARLEAMIAAERAPVVLLGQRHDIADLLAAADVVVLASDWEARALVAQEALHAGRPLVATAVGGLPDLLGDAALLVPPGDPAAVACAVSRLLDEPALADRLVSRGRQRAATWPTGAQVVDGVLAVYEELVRR